VSRRRRVTGSTRRTLGPSSPGEASGALLAGALAGVAARAAWATLRAKPPGGAERWDRVNHRGESLTLLEGPAYALAAAAAVGLAPRVPTRLRAAAVLATLGAGFFGAIDDLHESGQSKGLRGHLGELARGHVTTGGLKVLGIGATGLVAAALAAPGSTPERDQARLAARIGPSWPIVHDHGEGLGSEAMFSTDHGGVLDLVIGGAVIAGTANLLNLFDLRPGRALKVVLLAAPVATKGPAGRLVAVAAGAAATLLPIDLSEQAMLGDTGANAAGALLGTAAVAGLGRRGRIGALIGLSALTLASERVSFTKVIERTPGLREFDALGRRLPEPGRRPPEPGRRPPEPGRKPQG
jgi:hypothetical protein